MQPLQKAPGGNEMAALAHTHMTEWFYFIRAVLSYQLRLKRVHSVLSC